MSGKKVHDYFGYLKTILDEEKIYKYPETLD